MTIALASIRDLLAQHEPSLSATPFDAVNVRGAVALCLREAGEDTELLMIQRAEFEGDVWSGDIAFPGGRVDSAEEAPRAAAERETLEEVGIDLAGAEYLGRLDDIKGRTEAVLVSAFVYRVAPDQPVTPNYEVHDTRWMPMAEAWDARRQTHRDLEWEGRKVKAPALRVFDDEKVPLLWGLTYQFLVLFAEALGRPIPDLGWRTEL
jgi:8-oxo-dGTP pyrophosphatase MutT (NUDIX family)